VDGCGGVSGMEKEDTNINALQLETRKIAILSCMLCIIAMWQLGVGAFSHRIDDYLPDTIGLLLFGVGLQFFKSRIIAITFLIFNLISPVLLFIAPQDSYAPGDFFHGDIGDIVMVFICVFVTKAIFKFHKLKKLVPTITTRKPIIK